MRIPLNDLQRHFAPLAEELVGTAAEVIRRGRLMLDSNVEAFEREFAEYVGVAHAVGVANGTDALELALRAVGVEEGSRVVTVANAGGYATAAILAIGARPEYVEIDPVSGNMAPEALEVALAAAEIAAVVVTHLYGQMAEMARLAEFARSAGVPLVEDCAHAHGAQLAGRFAGAWGAAAAFSFYPTKNLGALGDGGAVVTGSEEIAAAVRRLRQYGWTSRYRVEVPGGRNSRLDELQAAFLRRLLPQLDGWNRRRRTIANELIQGLDGCRLKLPPAPGEDSVVHFFVVASGERDALRTRLAELGVQTDVHYPTPDYLQPATPAAARLPLTEEHCRSVLSLPCFPEMTDEEIAATIAAVRRSVA